MLSETVQEWTAEWVAEGRKQGIEQGCAEGLEQGRAEERALLRRQAARKFDDDTARRLAAVLAEVADPARLAEVGDWIIECGTGAELFARVMDARRSGAQRTAVLLKEVAEPERLTQVGDGIVERATEVEPFAPVTEARWSPTEMPPRLEEIETLLAEHSDEWMALWVEEGREQGREQGRAEGLERGRAEERALLCRQAARKFDDDDSQRLAAVLAEVADPERLAEVGDWIIECGTGAELFARVADVRRSETEALRLEKVPTRLAEQVRGWMAKSAAKGRAEGLEQGRAEERALLCRQAARKFDDDAARRLAAVLAEVADPERLAEVGDWIIECGTGAELFARVMDARRSGN